MKKIKASAKKSKKKNLKQEFGGLKKHDLQIQPINVFALKVEHCEETWSPSCGVPMTPGPTM